MFHPSPYLAIGGILAMTRNRTLGALLFGALGLFAVTPARAASPTLVTADWKGGASLPSDVAMYTYIPSKVATNPPLVTIIHYCGGSAQAVFGQASGIISAADQYGFIAVLPSNANASGSNGRCWDVTSTKAHTRNGGGDSHAIIQMVKYALTQYKANADRVYSTGDSSGAMMTELLLALYPDVYKAGAAFAGVPAGCSNEFDGSGLCGLPAQTAQQWGDRVRQMDSGYTGHRPRVQLFHGDADGTITYKNLAEAIKEWTNVLALPTTPTSTASGLKLGTHQASRQSWANSCGYVVFDALTSIGGDHGPSDALFQANFVLPFLGLDSQTAVNAAVDPEIQQCGGGGTGDAGAGGGPGSDGATGAGGSTTPRDGGVDGRDAGTSTGGGGNGGNTGSGSSGGSVSSGGTSATGGTSSMGGTSASGGSQASGGSANGGATESGGAQSSGGAVGTGGKSSSGGSAGSGSGGTASNGGAAGNSAPGGGTNGCGCTLGRATSNQHGGIAMFALGLALATFARRRRSKQ
jgi:poly(hydroxyalkanoate) depolymerase family esterase